MGRRSAPRRCTASEPRKCGRPLGQLLAGVARRRSGIDRAVRPVSHGDLPACSSPAWQGVARGERAPAPRNANRRLGGLLHAARRRDEHGHSSVGGCCLRALAGHGRGNLLRPHRNDNGGNPLAVRRAVMRSHLAAAGHLPPGRWHGNSPRSADSLRAHHVGDRIDPRDRHDGHRSRTLRPLRHADDPAHLVCSPDPGTPPLAVVG
ncbi:unannotated protein [freshwater metagenome]|uniref:Unannotated protein n=1 Tax=freshwater metagenome TaxID=449393 RepID=A0A6J6T4P5_9ZZZZ